MFAGIIFSIIISIFPLFLTIVNIHNLFAQRKFIRNATDIMIFTLGPVAMYFLYSTIWKPLPWQESISSSWYGLPFHQPVSEYTTILTLAAIAIMGYSVLRIRRKPLPPLFTVLCLSAVYMGCILSLMFILQLVPHIDEANAFFYFEGFLMCLFPLNYLICSSALTRHIIEQTEPFQSDTYKGKFMKWCSRMLANSRLYPVAAFILVIPLLGLITIILVLFGQKPDSFITAFSQTSDWLFSQKSAPAVEYYGCEYLCTAAAKGHARIVKPFRIGIRGGKRIIVNRQLCVANAFEELLEQKTPRFRKLLRGLYDTFGCPVAKRIQSPLAADIAYLLIKPLEWLMVLILYLVETKPENRIAKQYLPIE